MSSGVNMLRNSLKISDTSKTELLELISFQSDQKIWQKYCRADLNCVWDLFNMLTVHKYSETGLFRRLNNPGFYSL